MKGALDLAEAGEDVRGLQSALELLAWNAAQPVPIRQELAIKTPLAPRRNELRMIALIEHIVNALFERRQLFIANVRSGGQPRKQNFHQRVEFLVKRRLVGRLRVRIAHRRAPHRTSGNKFAAERRLLVRDPLGKKWIPVA